MKICSIIIAFALVLINSLAAQEYVHEFGKYSNADFDLTDCPFDPGANAIVIYDIGESSFAESENNLYVIFQKSYKVKILNNAGLKHAEISIPIYSGDKGAEQISNLKANSYNQNNGYIEVTPLNPKETFTEKINKHWSLKKFALPNIKEGTVFDVTYMIASPYIFNLRDWYFQQEIPVLFSQYTTKMHPLIEYSYQLQGRSKFDEFKTYSIHNTRLIVGDENNDIMAYEFKFKNIPSFPEDDYIIAENYRIKLNFQLSAYAWNGLVVKVLTTWPDLLKELSTHSNFGKYIKSSQKKSEEILATLILPSDEEEKIKFIRDWVAGNFNFDGDNALEAVKSVKDFMSVKTGNSAEINLFLTGMLQAAGIEAKPVIISTRNNGRLIGEYPFVDAFNYTLAMAEVNGKILLIDATNPLLKYKEIPTRCLNEKGLIVDTKEVKWLNFTSGLPSCSNYVIDLNINQESQQLKQQLTLKLTGYNAAESRYKYIHEYEDLFQTVVGSDNTDSLQQNNLSDIEKPFELSYKSITPLEIIDAKIIIDPFIQKSIKKNPFTQNSRNYPLDFNFKKSTSFESTITIPAGYSLVSKPDELVVDNPDIKIIYLVDDKTPGTIKVNAQYELKRDVYPAETYPKIKQYFNLIVNRLNEKLVLTPLN